MNCLYMWKLFYQSDTAIEAVLCGEYSHGYGGVVISGCSTPWIHEWKRITAFSEQDRFFNNTIEV